MDGKVHIERAGPSDLAMRSLASQRMPEQFGAVLIFDGSSGFDIPAAEALLAQRVCAIPRFRQKLVPLSGLRGRPIWVDDAAYMSTRHISHRPCREPGDERALLDLATQLVCDRLDDDRPLWRAVFVTGLIERRVGLVLVVDHVLADGIGGLAALGALVDGGVASPDERFPRRPPTASELRKDALRSSLQAARSAPVAIRGLVASLQAARRVRPARAADCSLLAVTGPTRRLAVVRGDLEAIRATAHRRGATVNDAILAAIGGALNRLLAHRGEHVDEFVVSEPISIRGAATAGNLGNRVNEMLVVVPAAGSSGLNEIADRTRAAKGASAVGVGSFVWLSALIRIAARTGLLRRYLNRQHMIHTVVSNVRGPGTQLDFAGNAITDVIPISVAEAWNVTVTFVAFSYLGKLTITITADTAHCADLEVLEESLRSELAVLERAAATDGRH